MNEKVNTMANGFSILIADRNPHVRKFLRRELETDGFHVLIAKNGREVLRLLNAGDPPDLLILDLDIPHVSGLEILKKLQDQEARLPVMVHTLLKEYADHPTVRNAVAFVEKTGDNVDGFKLVINDVLQKWYPMRYVNEPDREV
jgi:DNA-binding response OmpR family regulator